jgi:hypothetical protein
MFTQTWIKATLQSEGKPPRVIPVQSSSSNKQKPSTAIKTSFRLELIRILLFIHSESGADCRCRGTAEDAASGRDGAIYQTSKNRSKEATDWCA